MRYHRLFIALIIACSLCSTASSQNIDADLMRAINTNRNKSLDGFFTFISNTECPVGIGAPVITLGAGFIAKDKQLQRKGWENLVSFTLASISSTQLKKWVNRGRPATKYDFVDPYKNVSKYSFPSGHTTLAFSTATTLSLNFKKWYVVVPAYLWAGAMGYSRVHLGVHYPSDVLAGAVLGTGTAWLSHKAFQWFQKKPKKVKPAPFSPNL
ncbi:MAG TPA: phosphatase PAP2 family protein [Chitinophagaceae bacterium]